MGSDLDLPLLWRKLGDAAREAMMLAGASPGDVLAVAATSMRHTTIVLDDAGEALFAATNRDGRAVMEALTLAAEHGTEIYARSGRWPSPVAAAARLRWMAANQPEVLARAVTMLSLGDWLAWRLCGAFATDPTQANESLLLDVKQRRWATGLAASTGIDPRLLPELREPGTLLGALTPEAARHLGLRAGTPVVVGGGDTQCGAVGGAAVNPGDVAVVGGTTMPLLAVLDRPLVDPTERLWLGCHAVPGRWVLESNAGPVGENLGWLAGLLSPAAAEPVARLLAEASLAPRGSAGILSTLGAQVFSAKQLELPLGGLTLSYMATADGAAARAAVARSALEGIGHAVTANLAELQRVSGIVPGALRLVGGLSRSDVFTTILGEVTGLPVLRGPTAEESALGAAICAAVGAGVFPDLAAGARALVDDGRRFDPSSEACRTYADLRDTWQRHFASRAEADSHARDAALTALLARLGTSAAAAPRAVRPKILVTADMDDASLEALREIGDVEYASFRKVMRLLTGDALVEALRGVQVFVTEIDIVDGDVLAKAIDLRVVASCRGDAVNVDVPACTAAGVPVLNAPGRNADAVADLTLGFLLMLARKLPAATAFLHEEGGEAGDMGRMGRAFTALQGRELWRKTVGLVGLGAVGRRVARRLAGFGVRVLVHDPFLSREQAALVDAELVSLDDLLERSDFVSLHAPVTEQTRHMIAAAQLARMKPTACLVNTARSALVDEPALVGALSAGRIAGAALDVFSVEPPGWEDPLMLLPNVIATPHVGGNTVEVASHQGAIILDDLRSLLRGEPPRFALNPETLADFDWTKPRRPLSAAALAALGQRPGPAVSDLQRDRAGEAGGSRDAAPGAASAPASEPAAGDDVVARARERFERVLQTFCDRTESDEALLAVAAGKDVTLRFSVTDLGLRFFIRLRAGGVAARLGDPDGKPDVDLKMRAAVLDGMFTGTLNPMEAATTGKIAFSGETTKAMTVQQLQGDLSRLYREARDAAGGPGDLEAVAAAPTAGARQATAGTYPAAVAEGPSSCIVRVGDIRDEVVQVVNELFEAELITATGGNVSVRIPGRDDEVWITPSAMFKGDLQPALLVRVGLDGTPLDDDAHSPSSEVQMHCAVYRTRPDAHAVVHAHAPHATILVNSGTPFLPISTEAAFFGEIPRIPFVMPGTDALATAVADAVRASWAVLMGNHGLLVAGRSLRRAADMVEIVDRSCEVILGCFAVGKAPTVLPEDVCRMLRKMGDLVA
jgi:autoinducer 2 (AI-2) kinase